MRFVTAACLGIAGILTGLLLGYVLWGQHTVNLTKGADGKWRITITWPEGTSVEYKYTLGDWDHVEKGASCDEIANRKFTVAPSGDDATMTVEETVKNWRNVPPCGA